MCPHPSGPPVPSSLPAGALLPARSRRGFIATGVLAAGALAASSRATPALASEGGGDTGGAATGPAAAAADPLTGVDVRAYGAEADGLTDDTEAFAAAIAAAAEVRGRVLVPAGTYLIDSVTVPLLVKIVGLGADVSRYGAGTDGGVDLRHLASSTRPMIVVDGNGVTLENLTLQGNGSPAPLLEVVNGFESRFHRVHLATVAGTALLVHRVNNNLWTDVFVNNCGRDDEAAVVVKSPTAPGTNTNTFTCVNLHIEGSANVALDLAWGPTSDYFVEFVRLLAPHIETLQRTAGADATVRIGNVRQVELVAPTLYGGPGPLIEHGEQRRRGVPLDGGVRLIGGALLGADPERVAASETLVRLTEGDDFWMVGTRLGRFTGSGVSLGAGYGSRFGVDPSTRIDAAGAAVAIDDRRAVAARPEWAAPGDVVVGRRLRGSDAGASLTASVQGRNGVGAPTATVTGSDLRGTLVFGSGTSPREGGQVRVRFATAYAAPPVVVLTPATARAATSAAFVTMTPDGFVVETAAPLPAGLPGDALRFTFHVIG
jgi:hypothetical protein